MAIQVPPLWIVILWPCCKGTSGRFGQEVYAPTVTHFSRLSTVDYSRLVSKGVILNHVQTLGLSWKCWNFELCVWDLRNRRRLQGHCVRCQEFGQRDTWLSAEFLACVSWISWIQAFFEFVEAASINKILAESQCKEARVRHLKVSGCLVCHGVWDVLQML